MFLIHSVDDGHILPWEQQPCSAITPKVGYPLVFSSGNLAAPSATTKPAYISMYQRSAACTAGDPIGVVKVSPEVIFETQLSAAGTSLNVGDAVTLATGDDIGKVTATTTNGVATIVAFPDGDKSQGANVLVRFN